MSELDKPIVVQKMHQFIRKIRRNNNQIGTISRSITLDYNNACNFKCEFCYEEEAKVYSKESLSFDKIAELADEAHEIGIWEVILQGGELLIDLPKLLRIISAFKPERFRMILVSNGYLLTPETAKALADAGLDCLGISISGMDEEEHDRSRGGVKGAHKRALRALDYGKEAGLTVWAHSIFGHHNARSKDLFDLLEYLKKRDYGIYFCLAMPFGVWKDNYLDAEDLRIFQKIRKEYKASFDTWDFYDSKKEKITGCWSVNRLFITPLGDVLPCPYMNIKIGNVKEQPLKEIIDYGFGIKYFGEYSPICLSAQNRQFREKYLDQHMSMFHPAEASEIFGSDDFIIKN
ncbi:MAG: radical SAM protein [Eubacterium sp.]|nr:radical SAM protein [Eubacterium sp.]